MEPRHQAIAAGLALTLAFGTVGAPAASFATTPAEHDSAAAAGASGTPEGGADGATPGDGADTAADGDTAADVAAAEDDEQSEQLPEPGSYDRSLDYEGSTGDLPSIMMLSLNSLLSARSVSITPQSLSSEMKYFAEYESGRNYDQGFSYGDGYNAMGYYQFDRRYSLLSFMEACYSYDSTTYSMFKAVIDRGSELKGGTIYDSQTKQLTEIGKLADDAWHAAYAANPTEFAALQDNFAYQEYYLPAENILRSKFGADISGRADCVKGLVWGLCNLFGQGGCQKFFGYANLSDDMTDREFVNALCDAVVNNVDGYTYGASYRTRYERERATCLTYIAEDEAAAGKPDADDDAADGEVDAGAGDNATDNDAPSDDDAAGSDDDAVDDGGDADGDAGAADTPSDNGGANGPSDDAENNGDAESDAVTPPATDQPDAEVPGDGSNGADDDADAPAGDDGAANDGADTDSGDQDAGDTGASDDKPSTDNGAAGDANDSDTDSDGNLQSDGTSDGTSDGDASAGSGTDGSQTGGSVTDQPGDTADDGAGTNDGGQTGTASDGNADAPQQNSTDAGQNDANANPSGNQQQAQPATARAAAEPERLPATADAAGIGLLVSAGLSALGAGTVVAGKKMRGTKVPFEDGFRG